MKKIITTLSKIVLGIVVLVAILLITAAILLNTQKVQDELAAYATEQLELELGTRVKIKHASVNVFTQKVNLEGLEVEDLEHRKMFEMGRLLVDVNLMNLIANNLVVEEVLLDDVKAKLYKPLDGPANYQFLIETPSRRKKRKSRRTPRRSRL